MAQHEIAPPTAHACPACGTQRFVAEGLNNIRLVPTGAMLPGITSGWTELWALVCPHCGLATLYAKDPDKLERRK